MSEEKRLKILFLCTANSARSVLSEYLLRKIGGDRFESFSAGSQPRGEVHPLALRVLRDHLKIDAGDARSKSWEEYRDVQFDFVITVCDNARESCPYWPGQTLMAHWGLPDPAAVEGAPDQQLQAFQEAARVLSRRIEQFRNLPFEELDRPRLQQLLQEIGQQS